MLFVGFPVMPEKVMLDVLRLPSVSMILAVIVTVSPCVNGDVVKVMSVIMGVFSVVIRMFASSCAVLAWLSVAVTVSW